MKNLINYTEFLQAINILTLHVYAPIALCRFICVFMFPLRLNVAPQIEHACLLDPCDNLCCRN